MLRTIIYWSAAGLTSALYSRWLMRLPLLYKPQLHILTTGFCGYIGWYCSKTEDRFYVWCNHCYAVPEDAPKWIQKMLKARIDKVDLLNKIAEELPEEMKQTPYWEKRLLAGERKL